MKMERTFISYSAMSIPYFADAKNYEITGKPTTDL